MTALRILMTNNTLGHPAGSELNIRDMAIVLASRGHQVAAYSNVLGEAARQIREAGIPVFDDINQVPWQPDIIHGHHHMEAMTAISRFRSSPAIYFARGYIPWEEAPPLHPRILRYAAVDTPTLEFCLREHVPPERIQLILNFVNCVRFRPRTNPLPPRPRGALLLSHYASPADADLFRRACQARHISMDAVGLGVGKVVTPIERLLPDYDLVFGKGRSAFEAMSVGAALIIGDSDGVGPIVTQAELERLLRLSFGPTAYMGPLSVESILTQIDRYDPVDALAVSVRLRQIAPMEKTVDRLEALYRQAIEEFASLRIDPEAEAKAEAAYLGGLSLRVKHRYGTLVEERNRLAASLVSFRSLLVLRVRRLVGRVPVLEKPLRALARLIRGRRP